MSPEKTIRLQARKRLGDNNWSTAVGVTTLVAVVVMTVMYLCYAADTAFVAIIEAVEQAFNLNGSIEALEEGVLAAELMLPLLILISPLFVGFLRYIYILMKDGSSSFGEVFYYIGRRYGKTLGVTLMFILRNLWKFIVSFLPFTLLNALAVSMTSEKIENQESLAFLDIMCYVIVYAMLFGGILLCMKLCLKHFLYFYLYIEDDTLGINELPQLSALYMQRFTSSVMKLFLSLFPLVLSCILVIPCLFVVPYTAAALSTSAKWIIALQDNSGNKDES